MPLIIITGYPCSGKTFRARQLASAFEEKVASKARSDLPATSKPTIRHLPSYHSSACHLVFDETCPSRDLIYTSASVEKTARAAELSAVKRALSRDTIVIADGLNYIKGFRYQLWCEAKAVGTRCCTVHCAGREDEVLVWNRLRLRRWADSNGESLSKREEEEDTSTFYGQVEREAGVESCAPESHTAIFGDRVTALPQNSRSSSLVGDDADDAGPRPTTFIEESLKSFQLSNGPSANSENTMPPLTVGAQSPETLTTEPPSTAAALDFPPPSSRPYSSNTLQSLLMRYEPPSPFSKWDTPLFTVPACDEFPPISAIWDSLCPPSKVSAARKGGTSEVEAAVKPHAATVLPQVTEADALQMLERTTSDVAAQILAQMQKRPEMSQEGGCCGGDIQVRLAPDRVATLSVSMGTVLALPMLQRLRRRFTQIQRGGIAHGQGYVQGEKAVGEAFLRFLNAELGG